MKKVLFIFIMLILVATSFATGMMIWGRYGVFFDDPNNLWRFTTWGSQGIGPNIRIGSADDRMYQEVDLDQNQFRYYGSIGNIMVNMTSDNQSILFGYDVKKGFVVNGKGVCLSDGTNCPQAVACVNKLP